MRPTPIFRPLVSPAWTCRSRRRAPRLPQGKIDYSFDWVGGRPSPHGAAARSDGPDGDADLRAEIRQLILEELRALQRERR